LIADAPRTWLAYRVDAEAAPESLLTGVFAPWLADKTRVGELLYFFFLWYSEDGYHLRLRLRSAAGRAERLTADLAALAESASPRFRLSPQVYDRDTLAFGQTRESVIAELLHAVTSELALHLSSEAARSPGPNARWILTAATAAALVRRMVPGAELDAVMAAWIAFAAGTLRRAGFEVQEQDAARQLARLALLRTVVPRADAALARQATATRAVALLRRVRARGPRGQFVAIHALHLFCNQMGLTIHGEHDMLVTLQTFWAAEGTGVASEFGSRSSAAGIRR
jgi:thiopeptide-type bacteriocin biosynthesis protein